MTTVSHGMDGATAGRDYTPAIYGSLLVTAILAVPWHTDATTEQLGAALVIAVGVFWLTHVWATVVNERIHGLVDRARLRAVALDEAPMLAATILPFVVLAPAAVGAYRVETAVDLALGVSVVQLFVWGLAVGRATHSGWPLTLGIATVTCLLGLVLVILKVLVLH